MLPRNKKKSKSLLCLFFLIIFFLSAPWVHAQEDNKHIFIDFFQEHISPVDGDRCAMYPSCSVYASTAIKKHGSLIGWIMACDRLVRCGRDECEISSNIIRDNDKYTYDPVQANDFWWFDSQEKITIQ